MPQRYGKFGMQHTHVGIKAHNRKKALGKFQIEVAEEPGTNGNHSGDGVPQHYTPPQATMQARPAQEDDARETNVDGTEKK